MGRRDDRRSPEAAAYRGWYKTPLWRALRAAQLARQPLCERCLDNGRPISATVVNHARPHRGNWDLFRDPANLQSLCAPCHDGPVQSAERRGYAPDIGDDGWPTDERHPANRSGAYPAGVSGGSRIKIAPKGRF